MFNRVLSKRLVSFALAAAITFTGFSVSSVSAEAATNSYGLMENIQDGTIIQCFNWTYKQIIDELPNIAAAGFTSVQTSPAQVAFKGNDIWYYLYQPNTFTVGDSGLGSESDLKNLCQKADEYGIKVIVDVVANHLAGNHSNIDSSLKSSQYWHTYYGDIDYNNRWQITHGEIGMPDLNSEDSFVAYKVKNYIQQLKADGVDGIRWDAAKHISLPSEGCEFWKIALDKSMYNYGEILAAPVDNNDSFATQLMSEYTDYMSITDSNYSSIVMGAIKDGTVPTRLNYWESKSGITGNEIVYWAESHDTYSNNTNDGGWTKYISQNKVDRAYALVAARANATALYFSRPSETNKERIKVGVKGSTNFKNAQVAEVNKLHNNCSGEKEYFYSNTNDNVASVIRETGAVLVLGDGSNKGVSIPNGNSLLKAGTYYDRISGEKFTVTSSTISGKIGSTGIAVIYKETIDPDPEPVISADKASQTFKGQLNVNFAITADSYEIYVNGVKNNSLSQTFTETSVVEITAKRGSKTASKTYTYTYDGSVVTTRTIYLNTNSCSWFGNDKAVAAIKTDLDTAYTKMTTTEYNGVTVYTYNVDVNASSAKIVRMLPSGKTYNELTIALNNSNNMFVGNGGWSNIEGSVVGGEVPPVTEKVTVYFTNNNNWNQVKAYVWGGSNDKMDWPGQNMTYVKQNEYNQAVYKIEVATDTTGIIFTNGSGVQTVDIKSGITDNAGFYISGNNGKCTVGTYTFK